MAWRLSVALCVIGLAVLFLEAPALGASDVFSNVGPASQVPGGSLANAYPLGNYSLDMRFSAVDAGVFSGIDASGIPPMIAWLLAELVWEVTSFLANAMVVLFAFAFSLDLVGGSAETGGAGALAPVSEAMRSIYRNVFGEPWLVLAVLLTGVWAMWHALVRRRYTETASALGVSLVFLVIALAFVTQPERTIGQASRWSNEMSGAFLSLSSEGSIGNPARAKRNASDQLFALLVYEPWVVLEFGGREHCVRDDGDDDPKSVPVRPLSTNGARDAELSRRLAAATQVQADGKLCINNGRKYAPRFLRHHIGSPERKQHYEALRDGDTDKAPESDRAGYSLSDADKPAAEAMRKDGQYQRLLMALVIFGGELGAFLLLGALSVSVILAQVLALMLLAFAPVALVIGVFPGRGHDFFKSWLSRLAALLLRKAIYSLILAVVLAVAGAVGGATSSLGWLMSFGLQGGFFWAVFIGRRQLLGQLTQATTGHAAANAGPALRLLSVYAGARIAQRALRVRHWGKRTPHMGGRGSADAAPSSPPPLASGEPNALHNERASGGRRSASDPGASTRPDAPATDAGAAAPDTPTAPADLPRRAPDPSQPDRRAPGDATNPAQADVQPGQAPDAQGHGARAADAPRRPAADRSPGADSEPGESPLRHELRADAQRVHGPHQASSEDPADTTKPPPSRRAPSGERPPAPPAQPGRDRSTRRPEDDR